MNSSTTLSAIAEALALAQAQVASAVKSGENKFDKYRYAKYEDIAKAAKPVLAEHGLSVVFTADELVPLDERIVGANKDKVEQAVRVKVCARLLHKSGEWMESAAWGEGQDRADKAPYKAMTGAKKYLLAGLLAIPTTDDAEADEQVGGHGDGGSYRRDRAPGSKPSTQQGAGQGNGAAPQGHPAPAASRTAPTTPGSSTTATAPTEPTQAELKASQQRAAGAKRLIDEGLAAKAAARAEDSRRISVAFNRAASATSRDEALECICVIAGNGITKPAEVPADKVQALIDALDRLAGIEVEA